MHDHFSTLHERVLQQQRLIEEQITQLRALHGCEGSAPTPLRPETAPKTLKELRHQVQKHCASNGIYAHPMPASVELFAFGEKESASAIFLKYSQALLKWAELELILLKEWARGSDTETPYDAMLPPTEQELSIVRHFLESNDSENYRSAARLPDSAC